MIRIWLFDLDGVLIHPGGYREALRRAVIHYARATGLPERRLTEEEIESFEAQGITCEWDITAIAAAAFALSVGESNPGLALPAGLGDAFGGLHAAPNRPAFPDLAALARKLGDTRNIADTPSEAALISFRKEHAVADREGWNAFLTTILGHPRDFRASPILQHFQHYTIGSAAYRAQYGVAPQFETSSLLEEFDRRALPEALTGRLLEAHASGAAHCAVMTARPSQPKGVEGRTDEFPPEAELAMRLAGLADIPVAGAGHTLWLARRHSQPPDAFLKPRPAHALAAAALAVGATEADALDAAYQMSEAGKIRPPFDSLVGKSFQLAVFEDSPAGVRGARNAAEVLRACGLAPEFHAFGVAAGAEKQAALRNLGATVFPNSIQAVETALRESRMS